jgi:hypothetical protein
MMVGIAAADANIYSFRIPPSTDYVLLLSSADNIFYIPRRSAREEYKKPFYMR